MDNGLTQQKSPDVDKTPDIVFPRSLAPSFTRNPYNPCSSFKSRNVKHDVIQSLQYELTKLRNVQPTVPAEKDPKIAQNYVPACAKLLDLLLFRV